MSHELPYPSPKAKPLPTPALRARLGARTWVLLAFVALVVASAGVRLLTYDRYQPYLEYADEHNMYLLGRHWRGVEDVPVIPEWLAGYPPLYVWLNMGVQQAVEATWTGPWLLITDYFNVLRLVAVAAGVATTLLAISIGWQLGGALAGWFAGLVWGLSPVIVEHNNLAIPDPMVYLAAAASITMALRGWLRQSPGWMLGSLLAAIATIYLKYPAVYVLIPWGLVMLALARRDPRRMLPWLAALLAVGGLAAFYLVFGYGGLLLSNREADTARELFWENLFSPSRNLNNAWFAIYPIGMGAFAAVMAGAAAAYVYCRRRGLAVINPWLAGALLAFCAGGVMLTSTYSNVWLGAGKIRHVLPVTLALGALWGAGLAQIARAAGAWAAGRNWRPERAGAVVAAAALLAFAPGAVLGDIELARQFGRAAIQQVLWQWTDTNLTPDGLILGHPDSLVAHTWNRPWSGYDGVKTFEWWLEDEAQIAASTPERYVERGIRYFVVDAADVERYFSRPAQAAWIAQLTLVKMIPAAPELAGDTVWFYRMLPPEHAVDYDFGGQVTLAGYDLKIDPDSIQFRPYWRAAGRPASNYSMFIHLYPPDEDRLLAQYDGAPTVVERPTLTWDDPNELYIGGMAALALPDDLAAGAYRLAVGLYDYSSGARLTGDDGATYFSIPVTVGG